MKNAIVLTLAALAGVLFISFYYLRFKKSDALDQPLSYLLSAGFAFFFNAMIAFGEGHSWLAVIRSLYFLEPTILKHQSVFIQIAGFAFLGIYLYEVYRRIEHANLQFYFQQKEDARKNNARDWTMIFSTLTIVFVLFLVAVFKQ
jgi:hypothetical protein